MKGKSHFKLQSIYNKINQYIKLYNGSFSRAKLSTNIVKDLLSLNLGNALFEIDNAINFHKIPTDEICIILTKILEEEIIENALKFKNTIELLEMFDEQFISNIKNNNKELFDIYQEYLCYKIHSKNNSQNIHHTYRNTYDFEEFMNFIKNHSKKIESLTIELEKLELTLKTPCILTNNSMILRGLVRSIINYQKVAVEEDSILTIAIENESVVSKERLIHDCEKNQHSHLINKAIFTKEIIKLNNRYENQYYHNKPHIRRINTLLNIINKNSSAINYAYVFGITLVFLSRIYFESVGNDISDMLETNYNITDFHNKDWAQYYHYTNSKEFLNFLPCIITTILAITTVCSSMADTIFSISKTNSISNAINLQNIENNNSIETKEICLSDSLNTYIIPRGLINASLQLVDLFSHPLKSIIFNASVFRLLVPLSIMEEGMKKLDIKEKLLLKPLKNRKALKITMYFLSGSLLVSEYIMQYALNSGILKTSSNILIKASKSLSMIFFSYATPKITYNENYKISNFNSFIRLLSSIPIMLAFENTNRLMILSAISGLDVLLTSNSDRKYADSTSKIHHIKITDEILSVILKENITGEKYYLYKEGKLVNMYTANTKDAEKITSVSMDICKSKEHLLPSSYLIIDGKQNILSVFNKDCNTQL